MARSYHVISADSHLDLSPERWKHRVPSKWRDQAPRVVRLEGGDDAVLMGDRPPDRIGFTRSVGVPRDQIHLQVPQFETSGGTGSPEKRLSEQDQDGVDAEILFSRIQGTLRQLRDDEGYVALVHAYNEYLAEEYCAVAPDRLMAMGVTPKSGINAALAELEYCARAGFKGVLIDKYPSGKGYPTPDDDRFWAAAIEMKMPITHHTAGGSTRMLGRDEPTFLYPQTPVEGTDPLRQLFRFCGEAAFAPVQMAFAGVWDRFPDLQIYWAETQIGWLPYALVQIDDHYERYKYLAKYHYGVEWLKRPPSDYIRQGCLWGFLSDPYGIRQRDGMGVDRLMWGSDFAHAASDWPHSMQQIERDFAGVPEADRYVLTAGTAIEFFHLDS